MNWFLAAAGFIFVAISAVPSQVEKSACNTGNCCQACNSGSTRDILTAAETEEDIKKQIGIVFDKLLEQENSDPDKPAELKKSTEKLFKQLTISAYGVLYSFRTFTFSPNQTINEIKADNFTSFVKEYQPNFDRETGGMINLEDFVTERRMLGPRLLLLSFISNGEKNLNSKYQNLTRKEWLSATVCDTYKIEDCEKFRAKIKYFKKDLMIDLSSFNTLSKFIESNIDILQNKFNLNQSSYMSLMKYYISTISKYETESSSSGKNASAAATQAFSLKLLPMYCFILLFFI